jgi:hypothetical protein
MYQLQYDFLNPQSMQNVLYPCLKFWDNALKLNRATSTHIFVNCFSVYIFQSDAINL